MTTKRPLWCLRTDTMWGAIIIVVICMGLALYDFSEVREQSKEAQKEFAQIQKQHSKMLIEVKSFSNQIANLRKEVMSFQSLFSESIAENRKAIEAIQSDLGNHEVQVEHFDRVYENQIANEQTQLHLMDSNDLGQEIRNELDQYPVGFARKSPEMIAKVGELMRRQVAEFRDSLSEEQWAEVQERTDEMLDSSFEKSLSRMPKEMADEIRPMLEAQKERVRGDIQKSIMMQMMSEAELENLFYEQNESDELEAVHE